MAKAKSFCENSIHLYTNWTVREVINDSVSIGQFHLHFDYHYFLRLRQIPQLFVLNEVIYLVCIQIFQPFTVFFGFDVCRKHGSRCINLVLACSTRTSQPIHQCSSVEGWHTVYVISIFIHAGRVGVRYSC